MITDFWLHCLPLFFSDFRWFVLSFSPFPSLAVCPVSLAFVTPVLERHSPRPRCYRIQSKGLSPNCGRSLPSQSFSRPSKTFESSRQSGTSRFLGPRSSRNSKRLQHTNAGKSSLSYQTSLKAAWPGLRMTTSVRRSGRRQASACLSVVAGQVCLPYPHISRETYFNTATNACGADS